MNVLWFLQRDIKKHFGQIAFFHTLTSKKIWSFTPIEVSFFFPPKLRSRIGGENEMWIDPWLPNGQEKSFSFKMVSGWKVVFNLGPWPTFGFNSINKSLIKSEKKKKPILGLQRLIKSRQQPLHKVFLLAWKWGQGCKLQSKT